MRIGNPGSESSRYFKTSEPAAVWLWIQSPGMRPACRHHSRPTSSAFLSSRTNEFRIVEGVPGKRRTPGLQHAYERAVREMRLSACSSASEARPTPSRAAPITKSTSSTVSGPFTATVIQRARDRVRRAATAMRFFLIWRRSRAGGFDSDNSLTARSRMARSTGLVRCRSNPASRLRVRS